MTKHALYLFLFTLFFFTACKQAINPETLYGKWKYIKLENPNKNPPITVPDYQLKIEQPYIQFSKNNDLVLYWGGKVLSHGKFRIDGDKIQFKETLEDGKTREFPFYVSQLKDNTLIFETSGEEGSRVTAVKE